MSNQKKKRLIAIHKDRDTCVSGERLVPPAERQLVTGPTYFAS